LNPVDDLLAAAKDDAAQVGDRLKAFDDGEPTQRERAGARGAECGLGGSGGFGTTP
jgi:hypothetical protein